MTNLEVVRLDPDLEDEFWAIHCEEHDCGWCSCVAWWVPTWEGWGDRTAEENRAFREELFARGEHDGYLARIDGRPVGWCQAGPRDRLEKLVRQMGRPPAPDTWAITCFQVVPGHRRRGVADGLLAGVIEDLSGRGAKRVEAYPRRGGNLDPEEMWTGPLAIYERHGFAPLGGDPESPVLVRDLAGAD